MPYESGRLGHQYAGLAHIGLGNVPGTLNTLDLTAGMAMAGGYADDQPESIDLAAGLALAGLFSTDERLVWSAALAMAGLFTTSDRVTFTAALAMAGDFTKSAIQSVTVLAGLTMAGSLQVQLFGPGITSAYTVATQTAGVRSIARRLERTRTVAARLTATYRVERI